MNQIDLHSSGNTSQVLKPKYNKSGEFYRVLTERVNQAIPLGSRNDAASVYLKALFFIVMYIALFVLIYSSSSVAIQLVSFSFLGFIIAGIGFNFFHDSIHGAMSSNKKINQIFAHISCSFTGASRYLWYYKHNILHHQYPNIQKWDDDLETRKNLRLTNFQEQSVRYRYQYLYCPIIYAFTTLEWIFVKDFVQYFSLQMNEDQKIPKFTQSRKIEFWSAKITFLIITVIIPLCFIPVWVWALGTLLMHIVTSLILASIFQLAHINPECEITNVNSASEGQVGADWAEHQLRTTLDFAVDNRFLTWYSGGLNLQVPHHLYPSISHKHYPEIQKILIKTAKEFNLKYNYSPTYFGALKGHFLSLKKLGETKAI